MRKTILLGGMAVALSLALAACNQNTSSNTEPSGTQTASAPAPGSKSETASATKDAVAGAVGTLNAELTSSTKGFVEGAAMGDMFEIEASKIALRRSHSDDVKKFAQEMIDAHMETTADMKMALMHVNSSVTLPASFDTRHQGLLDDLNGAKDSDFDGRYLSQQGSAHDEALILMRGYANSGDNPDLKMFAANTMPKVQMHIDMLKSLTDAHKAKQRRADNR